MHTYVQNAIQKMTDENGYGKNRIKIYYIGKSNPENGTITAATQVMDNGSLHIGVAYCSPKDKFVKALGRKIALGRLMNICEYHYETHFTGHSSEDFLRIFNSGYDDFGKVVLKPTKFRNWFLAITNDFTWYIGNTKPTISVDINKLIC